MRLQSSILSLVCLTIAACNAQLDSKEMNLHLTAGAPILGTLSNDNVATSSWMSRLDNSTSVVSMNIPGTHDACAWNYTGALAEVINCQAVPLFEQLSAGIRFLDIRFGWNANMTQLVLYHGAALLSNTVQLVDVIWGLYHFLDEHPSETIFVSLKVDNGTTDLALQQAVYDMVTSSPTNSYWAQNTQLGTLGEVRKKLILFRRFGLDSSMTPVGIDVSLNWEDNNPDFSITYSSDASAWIEDFYSVPGNVTADAKIGQKYDATVAHLTNAEASGNSTQFFVTYASGSGAGVGGLPDVTPKSMAAGNGTVKGMNQRMLPYFQQNRAQRFGVVLFDFFDTVPELVSAVIGIDYVPSSSSNVTQGSTSGSSTGGSLSKSSSLLSIPAATVMCRLFVFVPIFALLL